VLADLEVPREPLDDLKYIPLSDTDPKTYLSLGANARERFEVNDNNFGIGGSPEDSYILSRLEVHSDFRIAGHLQFFFQLQSDEAPDKQHPSPVDADRLGVEQAFVANTEPLADGTFFTRIGRQEIGFDLQRFLSTRDGTNIRQAFDGATAAYTVGAWRFIAFYAYPVQNRNLRAFDDYSGPDFQFGLLRVERKLTDTSSLSAYVGRFEQNNVHYPSATGDERRSVVDVRLAGSSGGFDWDDEAMTQTGSIGSQSIRAWATGLLFGRTFDSISLSPRVSLQFDAASGDRNPTDDQLNTFNTLFPSGYYFTNAGYTTYANLLHIKTALRLTPNSDLRVTLAVGGEWRQTVADAIYTIPDVPLPNTAGKGGRYTGSYTQLRADDKVNSNVALGLEYVYFEVGPTISAAGGHNSHYIAMEARLAW
jgi:Alginate export